MHAHGRFPKADPGFIDKMPTKASQLSPSELYEAFTKNGVSYFCGVPDSLLSSFSFFLEGHAKDSHDIAVNEGNAVALAIGHYLATEEVPLVYMQNSGIGNAINPLVSLADPLVMGIPLVLLIGWRGQAGEPDEPQHKKQGLITTTLLDDIDIPYSILSANATEAFEQVATVVKDARELKKPVALLVKAGTLSQVQSPKKETKHPLSREEAIKAIIKNLDNTEAIIATTGKTSRELFEHRESFGQGHVQDLLIVGGMGHASTIGLAIARRKQNRNVFCIDGDGAVLMHMGALAGIGTRKPKNLYHFVINNGSHESVGGQPTVAFDIDLPAIARACGYRATYLVSDASELMGVMEAIRKEPGPVLVEVRVNSKSRPDLTRPTLSPSKNKDDFITFLKG